jgi:hypothetical protein
VHEEIVPTEHLTRVVADQIEYDSALEDGWTKDPYVPQAPPDKRKSIYPAKAEATDAPAKKRK